MVVRSRSKTTTKGDGIKMYKYEDRDTHIDKWYKGLFAMYFYKTDSERYGITDGFTLTFLGNNFNFAKEIRR